LPPDGFRRAISRAENLLQAQKGYRLGVARLRKLCVIISRMGKNGQKTSRDVATAYHEAGHAIVAWHEKMVVHKITIIPDGETHGKVTHSNVLKSIHLDFNRSRRARQRAERSIRVALAGTIAQRRYKPKSWRRDHSGDDHAKAADLAMAISVSDIEANDLLSLLDSQTTHIINRHWNLIDALAKEILRRRKMNSKEIKHFLSVHL
jgi:ATP-dependent Zn protease